MLGGNMAEGDEAIQQLFTDKMTVKLNVLGSLVKNLIFGYIDGSLIITLDGNGGDVYNGEVIEQTAELS